MAFSEAGKQSLAGAAADERKRFFPVGFGSHFWRYRIESLAERS
jgi:hypothetical protein